ncbi:hypothetical protein GUITHDRAFT_164167 [Guillardia theta CCMP2712]|uniref:Uncharacterized protein n=2 Tax=Guillardia theta TaxID=55529 RepID=L1J2S5_GUITC|nr:hypothetical protein GUITHDRAFT_164167 [Guillardia theta CCMP2712]EKX42395.1 hypothetical protein GUITHDRAFT_164167 [Guillardia theta CCMP2712]|eukprot:XP_005829375.1 hypothetical protein GUITHDRAFT_164167 [Guillardia theta CCMP2712]
MATGRERSRVLEGFRAIGVVTLPQRAVINKLGTENFVTTCVKRGFQVFDCNRLRLLFVSSPATPRSIKALEVYKDLTFAACGPIVHVFKRGKEIAQLKRQQGNVKLLLVVGEILFTYSSDGTIASFDVNTHEEISSYSLVEDGLVASTTQATSWIHPHTYLNKLLIGFDDGSLLLVNVNSKKLVHQFKSLESTVTCLSQSPAVDVVGVGLADGRILLRNIKFDETLMELEQADGSVNDLSFRTDFTSILSSCSPSGAIHIWNLEKQQLVASLPQAHDGAVQTCRFLSGEPLLLTTGADNALKVWIFDQEDGSARLLRCRNGHCEPPSRVRFYSPHTILSAGYDRSFRVFCTIQDQQSRELSQGHVAKKARKLDIKEEKLKLPPVVDFAFSSMRENDWANIITSHHDTNAAYTWRYKANAIGEHVLKPPPMDKNALDADARGEPFLPPDPLAVRGRVPGQIAEVEEKRRKRGGQASHETTLAKSVCISPCGNYGIVGYSCGRIDKYNMQSGKHRGTFWAYPPLGHSSSIFGLAMSGLGDELVSGSFDGTVKVWDFDKRKLLHTFDIGSPVNQLYMNTENSLLAVTSDDLQDDTEEAAAGPAMLPITEQLLPELITFSTVPRPRWQILANLDTIKARNKPLEPPQAPQQAPFFLPTLPGLEPKFVPNEEEREEEESKNSKIIHLSELRPSTKFIKLLRQALHLAPAPPPPALLFTFPPPALLLLIFLYLLRFLLLLFDFILLLFLRFPDSWSLIGSAVSPSTPPSRTVCGTSRSSRLLRSLSPSLDEDGELALFLDMLIGLERLRDLERRMWLKLKVESFPLVPSCSSSPIATHLLAGQTAESSLPRRRLRAHAVNSCT